MFTGATKIVKPEGQEADEFEQSVAQELFNLEVCEWGLFVSFHRFFVAELGMRSQGDSIALPQTPTTRRTTRGPAIAQRS